MTKLRLTRTTTIALAVVAFFASLAALESVRDKLTQWVEAIAVKELGWPADTFTRHENGGSPGQKQANLAKEY